MQANVKIVEEQIDDINLGAPKWKKFLRKLFRIEVKPRYDYKATVELDTDYIRVFDIVKCQNGHLFLVTDNPRQKQYTLSTIRFLDEIPKIKTITHFCTSFGDK